MKYSSLAALTVLLLSIHPPLLRSDETKGPERWRKSMTDFAERDATTPPPPGALLFVGSSSILMWDLAQSWPNEATINNGFGGSTLGDAIAHFKSLVPPYDPRAIILYAGDNDIKGGSTAEEVIARVKTMHALITAAKPGLPLIFIGIKPSLSRWALWPEMQKVNTAVAGFEGKLADFYYADVAALMLPASGEAPASTWFKKDGLHLSPEGYAKWTALVNETLRKAGVPVSP